MCLLIIVLNNSIDLFHCDPDKEIRLIVLRLGYGPRKHQMLSVGEGVQRPQAFRSWFP